MHQMSSSVSKPRSG
uniref:Uncharacterized protein n=1 Tax=Anguilla anguilla TaxID=7936 RepID=A0A0E9QIH4_ANGAN